MTSHDVIINIVDRLLAEREKNILLQYELNSLKKQQLNDEQSKAEWFIHNLKKSRSGHLLFLYYRII